MCVPTFLELSSVEVCLERLTDLVQLPDLDLDGLAGEGGAVACFHLGGGEEGLLRG